MFLLLFSNSNPGFLFNLMKFIIFLGILFLYSTKSKLYAFELFYTTNAKCATRNIWARQHLSTKELQQKVIYFLLRVCAYLLFFILLLVFFLYFCCFFRGGGYRDRKVIKYRDLDAPEESDFF